jgi:hypothetical protein
MSDRASQQEASSLSFERVENMRDSGRINPLHFRRDWVAGLIRIDEFGGGGQELLMQRRIERDRNLQVIGGIRAVAGDT